VSFTVGSDFAEKDAVAVRKVMLPIPIAATVTSTSPDTLMDVSVLGNLKREILIGHKAGVRGERHAISVRHYAK
jgi:hypothetical protein